MLIEVPVFLVSSIINSSKPVGCGTLIKRLFLFAIVFVGALVCIYHAENDGHWVAAESEGMAIG